MARKEALTAPLVDKNPVTLHVLGICSALAITNSLTSSLIMSVAVTSVLIFSNIAISLLRHHLPSSVRLIVQITIIASFVIVVDQMLKAYAFETSKQLSVFVGLIITNCIIMGRAEAFYIQNRLGQSLLDALDANVRIPQPMVRSGYLEREWLGDRGKPERKTASAILKSELLFAK